MNTTFLRNLTDREFLKQIRPVTDLEQMLAERLENVEPTDDELSALEDQVGELQGEVDDLRAYAKQLHEALSEADPKNELLDNEDSELLRL